MPCGVCREKLSFSTNVFYVVNGEVLRQPIIAAMLDFKDDHIN